MSRWFRLYDDTINDPKVIMMPEPMRWHWVAILCVASKNQGVLPEISDVAFGLRVSEKKAKSIVDDLVARRLLDKIDDVLVPHNWSGRQYQSDSSAQRVKRHREKRTAAGLEAQWSAPKALRQSVYERDGFACVYCGSKERLSLDHRTPEIRGGTHDPSNLATACISCNGAKRDMTEEEYRCRIGIVTSEETLLKRPQSTEQITEQKEPALRAGALTNSCVPREPKKRAKARAPLPDQWTLSEVDRTYAKNRGFADGQIASMSTAFENHHRAKGSLMADWSAAWRTWCENEIKFSRSNGNGYGGPRPLQNAGGDNPGSVVAAAGRLRERLRAFDEPAPGELRGAEGGGVVRLLPKG